MTFGIASIPSTGTRFTSSLLGLDWRHIDGGVSWVRFVQTRKIICPLRHPLAVIRSWRVLRAPDADNVFDCFNQLLQFQSYVDFWLPIDSEARDNHLQTISAAMGRTFVTDWDRVGASGQAGCLADGDEERAQPFIEFYERVVNGD